MIDKECVAEDECQYTLISILCLPKRVRLLFLLFQMDSKNNLFDATVITGLEKLAIKECENKLDNFELVSQTTGHVIFRTSSTFSTLVNLHSVDNLYVLIYKRNIDDLTKINSEELLSIFSNIISDCSWETGIPVWMQSCGFSKSDSNYILSKSVEIQCKPSFRVSCNRNGEHGFTSPEACCSFGSIVNDTFHWPVKLKEFDMEILLTIKNDSLIIGLSLTNQSLYKRYIVSFGVTTLRGTIAYNILQVADIKPNDIVCDPLCGTGVIPIECSMSWPETFVFSGDNHEKAIEKSYENHSANLLNKPDILRWDATKLPLKDAFVDVFVTDLPFGKRIGSKFNNKTLYPSLLLEMMRCACPETGRIVLLSQDKSNVKKCLFNPDIRKYCNLLKTFYVKVGGLDSSIFLVKRNKTCFDVPL